MPQSLVPPPKGSMYLFDYITPPLPQGSYRLAVKTDVDVDGGTQTLDEARYFDVVGPRFLLQPDDVAGVFPPRNGHGPFKDSLAQIVLKRRTLPWERPLDPSGRIGKPKDAPQLPANYPVPWLALLLFEEGEYTLLDNVPLENVVPADAFARMGSPRNILCSAVETDRRLAAAIVPSLEELQLLAHVRWVNIDDRELSVEGTDGWFAVLMTSRVPTPGAKCRACLVSLEERSDLVQADPPETFIPTAPPVIFHPLVRDFDVVVPERIRVIERPGDALLGRMHYYVVEKTRLVLLHSWQFTCEGEGTFYDLMQGLDVGLIGKVQRPGKPAVTDTGHIRLPLQDRGGSQETAWYRGPLVPFELTRDPLGPYHSADQARRVSPETGAEDVSYAAAFEVGRLLAAADARLAQELMRWRRAAYRQAARADTILRVHQDIGLDLPPTLAEQLHAPLAPLVATSAVARFVGGSPPVADRYGIRAAGRVVGMDPQALKEAWNLGSLDEARALLGADPGSLGAVTPAPAFTPRDNVTLASVAANPAAFDHLNVTRDRLLENVNIRLGGTP
jgi:hypothetical protein